MRLASRGSYQIRLREMSSSSLSSGKIADYLSPRRSSPTP
jgi:hypothetical protein